MKQSFSIIGFIIFFVFISSQSEAVLASPELGETLEYSFVVPSVTRSQSIKDIEERVVWQMPYFSSTVYDIVDEMISYPICVDAQHQRSATYYMETFGLEVKNHCDIVNPIFITGVQLSLNALFNPDLEMVEGCLLEIDLSGWHPLPDHLSHLFNPDRNDKLEIIDLALHALKINAFGPIVDCKVQYKGLGMHPDLYGQTLPEMALPVVNECHLSISIDEGNRIDANHHNRMGMEYYRVQRYQEAISYFAKAIDSDCRYFIAYTNLASVLAIEAQYYKSLAMLLRAKKLDPMLTLKKLLSDKDYRIMLNRTLKDQHDYLFTQNFISSICSNILKYWRIDSTVSDTDILLKSHCEDTGIVLNYFSARVKTGGPGSCTNYDFFLDKNGGVDRTQPLIVLRQGAPLYADTTSDNLVQVPIFLTFNKKVKAIALKGSRIQVKHVSSDNPLGWIERADLLCALRPTRGEKGLERKFYVNVATISQGTISLVKVYNSPEQPDCRRGGCRELTQAGGYFIFDEVQDRYLISDEYSPLDSSSLVGWVDKKDGTLWKTAYGLRPNVEGTICAYRTPEDVKTDKGCLLIPGGNRWFTSPDRIPLISKSDEYYKVLLPVMGNSVSIGSRFEKMIEAYIPKSDDIETDIWLKTKDLERWKKILWMLEEIESPSGTKRRTAFVISLTENLRQVLKGIYKNDQSLKDYIESRLISLPLRDNSPLLSYSYDDLMDKEQVPDCEISRLINWVHNSRQMLDIVSLGTRRPVYIEELYSDNCIRSDGSEISIPLIRNTRQKSLGPTDDYRYDHVFQKVRVFWVPAEFLP